MYIPFEQLPPHARLWIYQADRPISSDEEKVMVDRLTDFCSRWEAHGQPLATSFKIEFGQFIILSVDESSAGASGCSIDGSVRCLKELGQEVHINVFDRSKIAFLIDGQIQAYGLGQLTALFDSGKLSAATTTMNNLVATKLDWEKNWKTPVEKSWLAKYLPKDALFM